MLPRGGAWPSADVISSCSSSSNQKRLHHTHTHTHTGALAPRHFPYVWRYNLLPLSWPAVSTADSERGDGLGCDCCSSRTAGAGDDRAPNPTLLPNSARGKTEGVESTYGSCVERRAGSPVHKCARTPSLDCSPMSSSCCPPSEMYYSEASTDVSNMASNQSSRVKARKNSASPMAAGQRRKEEPSKKRSDFEAHNNPHYLKRQQEDSPFPMKMATGGGHYNPSVRVSRALLPHLLIPFCLSTCADAQTPTKRRISHHSNSTNASFHTCIPPNDERTKLLVVSENREERWRREGLRHEEQLIHQRAPRYSTETGNSVNSDDGSEDQSSDMGRTIDERLWWTASSRKHTAFYPFTSEGERSRTEDKLRRWKEARIHELVNKLGKKEAEISEWERTQTMKANMGVREFEMKQERKRAKALEKIQRSIAIAHEKAEKRKLKERTCSTRKISELSVKLPWKFLICL